MFESTTVTKSSLLPTCRPVAPSTVTLAAESTAVASTSTLEVSASRSTVSPSATSTPPIVREESIGTTRKVTVEIFLLIVGSN